MGRHHLRRDPEKRATKRALQRAAGYRGVKKKAPSHIWQHNSARMDRDGYRGEGRNDK